MNFPQAGDFIDIHVHGGSSAQGIFILESLMAHESKEPVDISGVAYTYGIHPWFLNTENYEAQLKEVRRVSLNPNVIAIGEAGFDKLRGPAYELQTEVFEKQVLISKKLGKPLIIHCVRSWEELVASHKKMKPVQPWMIHGFRGKIQLAEQLIARGLYLSIWFEFVLRPESAGLLRAIPRNRLFLETDGADVDIRDIYRKVSVDLNMSVDELKALLFFNFVEFFRSANPGIPA
jgi:TatD DNase family protein